MSSRLRARVPPPRFLAVSAARNDMRPTQLDQRNLAGHAQPERHEPESGAGVDVELRRASPIPAHVIGEEHSRERPSERADAELPAVRVRDKSQRKIQSSRILECLGLMRDEDRETSAATGKRRVEI